MDENYRALVSELREQANWWEARSAEVNSNEGRALLYGCALKLRYLVDRRDEEGNLLPKMTALSVQNEPPVNGDSMA